MTIFAKSMAESASDACNFHTQIVIKPPPLPLPFQADCLENLQEDRIPFFHSGSRCRRGDTWVISVFVILHVLVFVATMFVNDCWRNSHQQCALKSLGRLSFQPLSENPFLGPSASTIDKMGALWKNVLPQQTWRLFAFPCLHAGAIHLIINLCSVVFVGIHLEQEFGQLRIAIIYPLSGFVGTLVAALFVRDSPSVGSSGALYGLIGAMFSGLIWNWKVYSHKCEALVSLFLVLLVNFGLGLLPYVDNFANVGGLISGFLLGFLLFFTLPITQVAKSKADLFNDSFKNDMKLKIKQKLNRPILRSCSLLLFGLLLAGCLVAVLCGINLSQYCKWCQYIDCIPSKIWNCEGNSFSCQTMVSNEQLTLTCLGNGNFRVFPFSNISQERVQDLCSMICS